MRDEIFNGDDHDHDHELINPVQNRGRPSLKSNSGAPSKDYEDISSRIITSLSIYPLLSPSLLQSAIGPSIKPIKWRPILEDLVNRGIVIRESRWVLGHRHTTRVITLLSIVEEARRDVRPPISTHTTNDDSDDISDGSSNDGDDSNDSSDDYSEGEDGDDRHYKRVKIPLEEAPDWYNEGQN